MQLVATLSGLENVQKLMNNYKLHDEGAHNSVSG